VKPLPIEPPLARSGDEAGAPAEELSVPEVGSPLASGAPPLAWPKPDPIIREPKRLKSKPHVIPAHVRNLVLARDRMRCRWCMNPGGALDCHHRLRRSQGGKDEEGNLVSVHRLCHSYIHEHPEEAKRRGFLA